MWVEVLYFAALREQAGVARERVDTPATSVRELYEALRETRGLAFPLERMRVSVDGAFAAWDAPLHENAEIAFLPPVSGG